MLEQQAASAAWANLQQQQQQPQLDESMQVDTTVAQHEPAQHADAAQRHQQEQHAHAAAAADTSVETGTKPSFQAHWQHEQHREQHQDMPQGMQSSVNEQGCPAAAATHASEAVAEAAQVGYSDTPTAAA